MATICKKNQNFKIRMHHSGSGSTGILKATDYLSEDEEKECVAVIQPVRGYGVMYTLDEVKLRKDANYDCRDYIKVIILHSYSNLGDGFPPEFYIRRDLRLLLTIIHKRCEIPLLLT